MRDYIWAVEAQALTAIINDFNHFVSTMQAGPVQTAQDTGLPVRVVGKTAVVPISGPIMKRVPPLVKAFCPDRAGTEDIQQAIDAAVLDKKIDQIVLLIDSPGGSVDGTVELADTVFEARQQKPVIAQVDGMAASAAYWIASQASEIVSSGSSLVGSIGVFSVLYDQSEQYAAEGIKVIPVTTGKYKAAGMPGTVITKEVIADQQRIVDGYFKEFKDAIARGRSFLTATQINSVADGRVFLAEQEALKLGLVDRIGYVKQTLKSLEINNNKIKMSARFSALKTLGNSLRKEMQNES